MATTLPSTMMAILADGDTNPQSFIIVDPLLISGDTLVQVNSTLPLTFTQILTVLQHGTQPAVETTIANMAIQCIDDCHNHSLHQHDMTALTLLSLVSH